MNTHDAMRVCTGARGARRRRAESEHCVIRASLAALLTTGLLAASPALAVSVNVGASTLNGNGLVDNSGAGLLSFDPTYVNALPIDVVIVTDAADYLSSTCNLPKICLDWNGFFTNAAGVAWASFTLEASSPMSIAALGDVTPDFGSVDGTTQLDAQTAQIVFGLPAGEISGFELGGLDLGTVNWKLDITGVLPGQSVTLTLAPTAVPSPAAVWLFGGAIAVLGWLRRRAGRSITPLQLGIPTSRD